MSATQSNWPGGSGTLPEEQKLGGCFEIRKRMWVGTHGFPARQGEGHQRAAASSDGARWLETLQKTWAPRGSGGGGAV